MIGGRRRDHLEVGVRLMKEQDADFYFTGLIGERDGQLMDTGWAPDPAELTTGGRVFDDPVVYEMPFRALMTVVKRFMIHPDTILVQREILTRSGGFIERIWPAEDLHLMMRLADHAGRVLYRPDPVVTYRLPQGNSTSLTQPFLFEKLCEMFAVQHVRATCRRPEVRHCSTGEGKLDAATTRPTYARRGALPRGLNLCRAGVFYLSLVRLGRVSPTYLSPSDPRRIRPRSAGERDEGRTCGTSVMRELR